MSWYLFCCSQKHMDFNLGEIMCLCELFGVEVVEHDIGEALKEKIENYPFIRAKLDFGKKDPMDTLNKICQRSVIIKVVFEDFTSADNLETLYRSIPLEKVSPFVTKDKTFKIFIHSFNKRLKNREVSSAVTSLLRSTRNDVSWDAKADLDNPQTTFWLVYLFTRNATLFLIFFPLKNFADFWL